MSAERATEVVLLTPHGRGAVASLIVEGPRATECVGELFHGASAIPLAQAPLERILFGRWLSPDTGEEVVVSRRAADVVEVHCHGGRAAAAAIAATLTDRGCTLVDWQIWVRKSSDDGLAAEAHIALADAATLRVAAILWDQHTGALRRSLDEIAAAIVAGDTPGAQHRVETLLALAPIGLHLVTPWRVVLAGRPNAGKSSLINALCGFRRAIVHDTPGTTRDVVTALAALDGWPVELADTAGLHAAVDPVEVAGVHAARDRLSAADLVVLVFDASRPWSSADAVLAAEWPQALVVHSKCDLANPTARPGGVATSALAGQGIAELERAIAHRLVARPPQPGDAVPFTLRQVELLGTINDALSAGRLDDAARLVASLIRGCDSPAC